LLHCHAGCSYRQVINALGLLSPYPDACGFARSFSQPCDDTDRARWRTHAVHNIWARSKPAAGTLVETYLRSRCITITPPPSLRLNPSLKHQSGVYLPAMVAAVQDCDGKIVAVHRTFLAADGTDKANVEPNKMMLGPVAGGAVRFAKTAETLTVGEGIETMLSIAQARPELAVWAALSTSGLRALQLPEQVRKVFVCADGDKPGEDAARAAGLRFIREGRKALIVRPGAGWDFNDLLRGELQQ
jgi:hypothetical protein